MVILINRSLDLEADIPAGSGLAMATGRAGAIMCQTLVKKAGHSAEKCRIRRALARHAERRGRAAWILRPRAGR
jgi:hypothetical protein